MNSTRLKQAEKLFAPLGGNLRSRSMFGGYGLFIDNVMFAAFLPEGIALRGGPKLIATYQSLGLTAFSYSKKGFPVQTSYYLCPEPLVQDQGKLLELAALALENANKDKLSTRLCSTKRLKDLPNLRLATERLLKKAEINTVDELMALGAAEAYNAIKHRQPEPPKIELLWALEGAITGVHWSLISEQRRNELLTQTKD